MQSIIEGGPHSAFTASFQLYMAALCRSGYSVLLGKHVCASLIKFTFSSPILHELLGIIKHCFLRLCII